MERSRGMLKPRRLATRPVSLPHPLNSLPCGVGVAGAGITVHDLRELFTEFVGKLRLIGKVVERSIVGSQGHLEPTEGGTLAQHRIRSEERRVGKECSGPPLYETSQKHQE